MKRLVSIMIGVFGVVALFAASMNTVNLLAGAALLTVCAMVDEKVME